MRKYLFRVTLLFLLCVCGLSLVELLARRSFDTVRFKYEWVRDNAGELETLVLGPSTMYFDINPGEFETVSFNAAFSYQQPRYDWLMLTADTSNMRSLKNVLLDITSVYENGVVEQREVIPYKLYCGCRDYPFNRYSFELSNLFKCRNKIKREFHLDDGDRCEENGWHPQRTEGRLRSLDRKSAAEGVVRAERYASREDCGVDYPGLMVDYCRRHGVRVILVRPPVFWKYRQTVEGEFAFSERIDSLAARMKSEYGNVEYADYSSDCRFFFSDFHDPIHLNLEGARKWSGILKDDFNL